MIKLYELGSTRSARCRWTLLELDIPFEAENGGEIKGTAAYKEIHPLGLLPALDVDGKTLFESVAICNWLADQAPEKQLIPKAGTWERALHDQWTCFALNEMEAYLWSNARQTLKYAEDERVRDIIPQNSAQFSIAAAALDDALSGHDYLVGDRFSVTDIIVSFTVNWGRNVGLLADFGNPQPLSRRPSRAPALHPPQGDVSHRTVSHSPCQRTGSPSNYRQ